MMTIQVGGLSEGVHQYTFQVVASDLGLGTEYPGTVEVQATLEKTSGQMLLSARILTLARFLCDRCVAEFDSTLTPSYQMFYVWNDESAGRYDPAEVQVVQPGLACIDIAEDVRQTIMLAVPLKLLCRDDCRGLCPRCGQNLNIATCTCGDTATDSRWEKLRLPQGK